MHNPHWVHITGVSIFGSRLTTNILDIEGFWVFSCSNEQNSLQVSQPRHLSGTIDKILLTNVMVNPNRIILQNIKNLLHVLLLLDVLQDGTGD
jgi:hypothetical protein